MVWMLKHIFFFCYHNFLLIEKIVKKKLLKSCTFWTKNDTMYPIRIH